MGCAHIPHFAFLILFNFYFYFTVLFFNPRAKRKRKKWHQKEGYDWPSYLCILGCETGNTESNLFPTNTAVGTTKIKRELTLSSNTGRLCVCQAWLQSWTSQRYPRPDQTPSSWWEQPARPRGHGYRQKGDTPSLPGAERGDRTEKGDMASGRMRHHTPLRRETVLLVRRTSHFSEYFSQQEKSASKSMNYKTINSAGHPRTPAKPRNWEWEGGGDMELVLYVFISKDS